VEDLILKNRLRILDARKAKHGDNMVCSWSTTGRPADHAVLATELVADPEVKEFTG
jgi:hypothetical protein